MRGESAVTSDKARSRDIFSLVYAVFTAGLCSIVYELLIATTVAYFEGDSVKYFSLTIGLYMASMGAGAFVSKFIQTDLLKTLIGAEILLGFLGGASVPVLYVAFSHTDLFLETYVVLTLLIGFLIGLEIPFLTRILERYNSLRVSIAHVLSLDYLGALVATLAFPLVLLPFFGVFKSGLFFGLLNMSIGLLLVWRFPTQIGKPAAGLFRSLSVLIILAIAGGLFTANISLKAWNDSVYDGRVLFTKRTKYQQIVLTKYRDDLRLYLDGNLQFSSIDEYRYHEALVHVPLAVLRQHGRKRLSLLFLGGGDGLAVREALKYDEIARVTLIDLDPEVTRIARENPHVTTLNENSLTKDARVRVINADAYAYLKSATNLYDLIVADLPDPNNTDLARLYTREFYRLAKSRLTPDGLFVTQATSPVFARRAFWGIRKTVADEFTHVHPYHLLVPSFGDWGFVVASDKEFEPKTALSTLSGKTRYLDPKSSDALFMFGKDLLPEKPIESSSLDRPIVLNYYLDGWRYWGR